MQAATRGRAREAVLCDRGEPLSNQWRSLATSRCSSPIAHRGMARRTSRAWGIRPHSRARARPSRSARPRVPSRSGTSADPPDRPGGSCVVASELAIPIPAAACPVIARLVAASHGPDDPARYLIDRMIGTLPDGAARTIATRRSRVCAPPVCGVRPVGDFRAVAVTDARSRSTRLAADRESSCA